MNPLERYHHHPAMRLLRHSLRKERNLMIAFDVILVGGGNWFGWYFFKRENVLAVFGLAALLLGIRLAWNALRYPDIEGHRLFYLLGKKPEKIVWVYSLQTQSMPFGFHIWDAGTLYFKLSDGGEIAVSLPARKLKMVSKFLNRILPHASFGYSDERQEQFEKNPMSLKK